MSSAEPRTWVVDASVAFGWFAEVAQSERAVALLEAQPASQLIAPDLVVVDLLNAGWRAQRQGAISEAQFLAIGELAPTLFSDLVPSAALLARAQRWCQLLDHPAYDCLYLALAELRSAVLLTQDQRLLRKVQQVPQAAGLAMAIEQLPLA
ncbi:MAG: type II toxin-antitoxin system VapC family toxin [Cyanobium sp.]|nr:type II toxin-antitoxin system VapC family toxin [Cyanobium sp.]